MILKKTHLLVFVIIILLQAGCIVKQPPPREPPKIRLTPREKELSYRRILKADSSQHELIGYVEESTIVFPGSPNSYKIYYIKNKVLKPVGFVRENGATYHYELNGNAVKVGDFTLEVGAKQLLGFTGAIIFEKFNPEFILE